MRFLLPCATHLHPPDSFVILKIKDVWIKKCEEYKLHFIQEGRRANEIQKEGNWSSKFKNLKLAIRVIREVNKRRDKVGLIYAWKGMICCGLTLDVAGEWLKELTPGL